MSFPNIPNISPTITVTREEAINLLLSSEDLLAIDQSVREMLDTTIKQEMILLFECIHTARSDWPKKALRVRQVQVVRRV